MGLWLRSWNMAAIPFYKTGGIYGTFFCSAYRRMGQPRSKTNACRHFSRGSGHCTLNPDCHGGQAAIALAMVTSMIKLFEMPLGGSVTLLSMLFLALIGYWYGPYAGIMTAAAYGLLQFAMEPIFYTLPQMLTDYPLAFGALGLSGFFRRQKHGLLKGYIAGVLGRYFFSFLSGIIFFAAYAPDTMAAPVYSLLYNGSYLGAEAVITLAVIALPPVANGLEQIKRMAFEE